MSNTDARVGMRVFVRTEKGLYESGQITKVDKRSDMATVAWDDRSESRCPTSLFRGYKCPKCGSHGTHYCPDDRKEQWLGF